MKKVSLISIIFLIYVIAFCYNVFAQSTFNAETLTNAIRNYVQSHIPDAKVEIKQTINPKKFSQKDVIATISHKGNLKGNCSVNLIFRHNNGVLTELPVKINITAKQNTNNAFNNITINKGDKIKMLHYSGAICIKMDGVAIESGSTGDVIKVKKDNNHTLYGFVAEDGNVIIENKNNLVGK